MKVNINKLKILHLLEIVLITLACWYAYRAGFEKVIFHTLGIILTSVIMLRYSDALGRFSRIVKMLSISYILMALVDVIYAGMEIFYDLKMANSNLLILSYLIINTLIYLTLFTYYLRIIENTKNDLQFKLNLYFTSTLVIISILQVIYTIYNPAENSISQLFAVVAYISLDAICVIVVITMFISSDSKRLNSKVRLFLLGYLLFAIGDSLNVLSYTLSDRVLIAIGTLFTMVALYFQSVAIYKIATSSESLALDEGYYKPTVELSINYLLGMTIIPLTLYLTRLISIQSLILNSLIIFSHILISYYLNKRELNESIYLNDTLLREKLKTLVSEQTSELTEINTALEKKVRIDSLTGIYNRKFVYEFLNENIKLSKPMSLMYLDLDRFKVINDLHGHYFGDDVLLEIANRLKPFSNEDVKISRMGGDEFVVICTNDDIGAAEDIAKSIQEIIAQPLSVHGLMIKLGVSIGIANYPLDAHTTDQLLKNAEISMYRAKNNIVSDKIVRYSAEQLLRYKRENFIELQLKHADVSRDFVIRYQPIINFESNKIDRVEALIKWDHITEGIIEPLEFLPIAEKNEIITDLTLWLLRTATAQITDWRERYACDWTLNINVSPQVLGIADIHHSIGKILKQSNIDGSKICFEIAEDDAMKSIELMNRVFEVLSELGISCLIDNFGLGHTSLSVLRKLNISSLKIAKEIIDRLDMDRQDQLIFESIILMANGLGLETFAKGIERESQLDAVRELGCSNAQGYNIAEPMSAEKIENTILNRID